MNLVPLLAIHSFIQRHLSLKEYKGDLKKDKEFKHLQQVITAKQKKLKKTWQG